MSDMVRLRINDRRPFFAEASLEDGELTLTTPGAQALLYAADGTLADVPDVNDFVIGPDSTVQAVCTPDLTSRDPGFYELIIAFGAIGDDGIIRSYSVSEFFEIISTPAPYPGIYVWVWELLEKDNSEVTSWSIDLYAGNAIARLQDVYPQLGPYGDLSPQDRRHLDEGVGHLVAVRMRPKMAKTAAIGDVIRAHSEDIHMQFAEQTKNRKALETLWMDAAKLALGRVSAIKAQIAARAGSFRMFSVSGPTRHAEANGHKDTLLGGLIRLLSDEAADVIEAADNTP